MCLYVCMFIPLSQQNLVKTIALQSLEMWRRGCYDLTVDLSALFTCHQRFKDMLSIRYDTIRYDSVYLTCSKKLTGSQLSLPHGMNKKLQSETKNKMMSVIGPVQSRYREAVQ